MLSTTTTRGRRRWSSASTTPSGESPNFLGTSHCLCRVELARPLNAGTLHTRFLNSIKAVAIHERNGQSVTVKEDFTKYAPTGIGMRLEKVDVLTRASILTGSQGVYVTGLVPGGAAWRAHETRVGDKIRMIDQMEVGDMQLPEITKCIQGQAGTKVRLNGRRRGTRAKRSQCRSLTVSLPCHYLHTRARARSLALPYLSNACTHTHIHPDPPEDPARGSRRGWKCRG